MTEPTSTQWRAAPSNDPESTLTGALYQCNPVRADMIITFAAGPAGRTHPARDNTTKYYQATR